MCTGWWPMTPKLSGCHTSDGSVAVGVALVAAAAALLMALALIVVGLRQHALLRAAADAAAVSAADARRGITAGVPCDVAARIARLNGFDVAECTATERGMLVVLHHDSVFGSMSATAHGGRPTG
jgi:hypothetical protein